MKRIFLFIVLAGLLVAGLSLTSMSRPLARNDRYRPGDWVSYGVSRYITSIATGTQHAYFGSSDGILRYEIFRNRWEAPYSVSDGLPDNQIFAVAYDISTSFLWCSTRDGVSYMHPSSLRWTNFSKGNIGISTNDDVVSIGAGQQSMWFETRSRRLFKVDKFGNVMIAADGAALENNIVWSGLRALRPKPLPHFFVPAGYVFDPMGVFQDFRLRRAEVTSILRDNWDSFWLGTWGFGAWRANAHVQRAEQLSFGLIQRRVDALAFDDRGLWIGGRNDFFNTNSFEGETRGITYWRNPSGGSSGANDWRYYEARFNLEMSSDEVNSFAFAEAKLYCATQEGVNIYDVKRDRWRRIVSTDGLLSKRVHDVSVYNGFLWAATELGLNRINLGTVGQDSLDIVPIAPDQLLHVPIYDLERTENLLWMGTERGPYVYDIAKSSGGFLADNDRPTRRISHSDSLIWFGTIDGVEVFDMENKTWVGAPSRQRFSSTTIHSLLAQPEAVWVGTDAGVFKYNRKNQEWRQFTIEDGLIDNRVNAIAAQDDDWIWFGTPSGLTAFRWNDPHRID